MPEQAFVDAAAVEERIEDQLLGFLKDPRRRRQTSSQNTINSASTTSGGTTRTAVSRAILMYFSARGACFGVIVTTGAAAVGDAVGMATVVASALIAGIDIEIVSPRFNERAARKCARPDWIRPQHA
jgi:hypothetical protein